MSRALARSLPPDPICDEAMRQLRVWNKQVPPVVQDAFGDLPEDLRLYVTDVLSDRFAHGFDGDCAEVGRRLLAYLHNYVETSARASL
jgi:hypothetical protein